MEILTPDDLKTKFKDPWITPYKKVITMVDDDRVELIEYHPCVAGSEWMVYQYKRTSDLVMDSKRDGDRHTYYLKVGKADMTLKPSFSAAGIEKVTVEDDEVCLLYTSDAADEEDSVD